MPLTVVSLAAACTSGDLRLNVGNTTSGFPAVGTINANQPMKVDQEFMFITGVPAVGIVTVRGRGSEGTFAVAHDVLAKVLTSANINDFPSPGSPLESQNTPAVDNEVTLGQDQTVTPPNVSTTYYITKATAAAITLLSGSPAQAGTVLTFVSMTAVQHTITYTPGFNANTTLSDVVTFSGSIGSSFMCAVLPDGTLAPLSTNAATIA